MGGAIWKQLLKLEEEANEVWAARFMVSIFGFASEGAAGV